MHTFRHALRTSDFALTAELLLDAGRNSSGLLADARLLAPLVDAVQVTDNPGTRVHLSPLAAAALLIGQGIDPLVHLSCRDRNRIALRSELLGAAALGVSSLLLLRGRDLPDALDPPVPAVYDWGARKLISFASSMQAADFMIGTIATVFKPERNWEPEQIFDKADAGARFIQTQLCFDIDLLRHYMACLVAKRVVERTNVIVGLAPIPSADVGKWLGKNLRGAVVPAKIVKRLRQARDAEHEGVRICAELLQQVREIPGTAGVNVACLGDPEAVASAIRMSGVRN